MPQQPKGPREFMGFRAHPLIRAHVLEEAEARDCPYGDYIAAILAQQIGRPGLAPLPDRIDGPPAQQNTLDLDVEGDPGVPMTG